MLLDAGILADSEPPMASDPSRAQSLMDAQSSKVDVVTTQPTNPDVEMTETATTQVDTNQATPEEMD